MWGNIATLRHLAHQEADLEDSLEFDFLAACVATVTNAGNIAIYNNFFSKQEADGIICCVILLMLTVNRISHANLALQQTRAVQKLLEQLSNACGRGDTAAEATVRKELSSLTDNLAATLLAKRFFMKMTSSDSFEIDPRFLLFEFSHGILLRESQVVLIRKLLGEVNDGRSVCHQMIMGAGKTTVVGPLVAMLLADHKTMVMEVVPAALLDFSAGVVRERFSTAIRKPVFTFSFDRYQKVTPQLLYKLQIARHLRAVVVSTPSAVKSFMLKFIEICHNLNRQKYLLDESKEMDKAHKSHWVRRLLGLQSKKSSSCGALTQDEIISLKQQAGVCQQIFEMFRATVEIMDEVDLLLHPLKSELNWPLGEKQPLDFTGSSVGGNGLRWNIPSYLLDAIFGCCGMPILADIADSREASKCFG